MNEPCAGANTFWRYLLLLHIEPGVWSRHSAEQLAAARVKAKRIGELYGVTSTPASTSGAAWLFADTRYPPFGAAIVVSPFEPVAIGQEFFRSAGVGTRSGGGVGLGLHMWALYSLAVNDETDICRQVLQRQRARSRSERSPVYAGLGVSLRHMGRRDGSAHAPSFDKHVADIQVAEGLS